MRDVSGRAAEEYTDHMSSVRKSKAPGPRQPDSIVASPDPAMIDAARTEPGGIPVPVEDLPLTALRPAAQAAFTGYTSHDPEYRRIKFALFVAGFVTFAQIYEVQVLLPDISKFFSISPVTASLALSLTTLALAISMFFIGPSSERLGRRPIILISLFVASLLGIILGFTPNWGFLMVGRFLQGMALAGLPAVATAYLAEEICPAELPKAAGSYVAGTAIGGMLGRIISGFLSHLVGWDMTITILGCIGVVGTVLAWLLLPKQEGFSKAEPGLKALLQHTKDVLTEPGLVLLFVIAGTALGAYQSILNMMPYRLTDAPYFMATWIVSLIFLVNLFGSVAASAAGSLASRFGRRAVVPLAGIIYLVGILMTLARPLWAIFAGLIVFTIGFFAVHSVATGWVTARAVSGVGATGQASSAYSIVYYAGGSIFGTLAGFGWTALGWLGVVVISGSLAVVVIILALILRHIKPLSASGY